MSKQSVHVPVLPLPYGMYVFNDELYISLNLNFVFLRLVVKKNFVPFGVITTKEQKVLSSLLIVTIQNEYSKHEKNFTVFSNVLICSMYLFLSLLTNKIYPVNPTHFLDFQNLQFSFE